MKPCQFEQVTPSVVVRCVSVMFLTACRRRYPTESLSAAVLQLHGTVRWWTAVLRSCVWHHSPDTSLWRTCQENGEKPHLTWTPLTGCVNSIELVVSKCVCGRIISCVEMATDAVCSNSGVHVRRPSRLHWLRNTRRRDDEVHADRRSPFPQLCHRATC